MGTKNTPKPSNTPNKALEREALAALRAHRQQSGYVPWNHDDNPRLKQRDDQQRQRERAQQAWLIGQHIHQRRARAATTTFITV
ncbi:MAG: hypothetical protein JRI35_09925, partial [Deltaproteobacteria bacterium]|nr:hypothetical protein [Deltaproteobacteria bacterium]